MERELPKALFDLALWDQLSRRECEDIAHQVAALLPSSFRFVSVKTYTVEMQRHRIARFEWKTPAQKRPSPFVLIPGDTRTLGYDPTQRLLPDEELLREWQEGTQEYHGDMMTIDGELIRDILPINYEAFYAELESALLPLRTVSLQPFLLEVAAQEASEVMPRPFATYHRYKSDLPKQGYLSWLDLRREHYRIPHRHVMVFIRRDGFRLATVDEWEYACSAGSRSLFHWGDGVFTGEYDSVTSAMGHKYKHNAFGLKVARDPYDWEYCAEPSLMRGGDGGASCCGGAGLLAMELPLASAYIHRLDPDRVNGGVCSPRFRRVYDFIHPPQLFHRSLPSANADTSLQP